MKLEERCDITEVYSDIKRFDLEQVNAVYLCYSMSEFGALPLPPVNNPYRFMISDVMASKIREVYDYEWTDEEV